MTGEELDYFILQHTGLTAEQHPEAHGNAYRLAFAVMAATVEDCLAESRKDFPSPAAWQLKDEAGKPIGFSSMKNVAIAHANAGGQAIPLYKATTGESK